MLYVATFLAKAGTFDEAAEMQEVLKQAARARAQARPLGSLAQSGFRLVHVPGSGNVVDSQKQEVQPAQTPGQTPIKSPAPKKAKNEGTQNDGRNCPVTIDTQLTLELDDADADMTPKTPTPRKLDDAFQSAADAANTPKDEQSLVRELFVPWPDSYMHGGLGFG